MWKNTLIFLCFSFLPLNSHAQYFINGKVLNSQLEPIELANVKLLHTDTFLLGASTDSIGLFSFEVRDTGIYKLLVSHIGYSNTENSEIVRSIITSVDPIILNDNELSEVVVIGKKPTITRGVDKITFDVKNTILSQNNVWAILKKTPGVIIKNDEEIFVNNGGALVTINNQRTYLSGNNLKQYLLSISGESLETIEVITNPDASYDAEGNAILNFKLIKDNIPNGYQGNVYSKLTKATYSTLDLGISQILKGKNFYLNGFLNVKNSKNYRFNQDVINFLNNERQINAIWETNLDRIENFKSYNGKIGLDLDLNTKNKLSINASIFSEPNRTMDISPKTNIYNPLLEIDSALITNTIRESNTLYYNLNTLYKYNFSEESYFQLKADYINYRYDGFQDIDTNYFIGQNTATTRNSRFQTSDAQRNTLFVSSADFSKKVNDKIGLALGLKYTNIDIKSSLDYFSLLNTSREFVDELSDQFVYEEVNFASYVNLKGSLKKLSYNVGLRAENTSIEGFSNSTNQLNTQNYLKLFPSFSLAIELKNTNTLGLAYSKRIARPDYSSLNPFKYFFNEFSFSVGNPDLNPSLADRWTLTYSLDDVFLGILYKVEHNPFLEIAFQDNTTKFIQYIETNILDSRFLGANLAYNFQKLDWIDVYSEMFLYYQKDNFLNSNLELNNAIWTYYFSTSSEFTISKKLKMAAGVSFDYSGPTIQGGYTISPTNNLSVSLSKKFLKGKLNVSLFLNDLLKGEKAISKNLYDDQNNFYVDYSDTRYLLLSCSYSFGNKSLEEKEERESIEENDRLNL